MKIYLIGFMGTGKSSLGRIVAKHLQVPFLDIDEMIEIKLDLPISHIFEELGEDEFRKIEAKTIRETILQEKALIATGGGSPIYHHNMQWMLEHGVTMYLQWPEDILLANLIQHKAIRPLLSNLNDREAIITAKDLLAERIPVYEQSSMTLELSGDFEKDHKLLEKACKYIW